MAASRRGEDAQSGAASAVVQTAASGLLDERDRATSSVTNPGAGSRSARSITSHRLRSIPASRHAISSPGVVAGPSAEPLTPVSYTHLRAHETRHDLVC